MRRRTILGGIGGLVATTGCTTRFSYYAAGRDLTRTTLTFSIGHPYRIDFLENANTTEERTFRGRIIPSENAARRIDYRRLDESGDTVREFVRKTAFDDELLLVLHATIPSSAYRFELWKLVRDGDQFRAFVALDRESNTGPAAMVGRVIVVRVSRKGDTIPVGIRFTQV